MEEVHEGRSMYQYGTKEKSAYQTFVLYDRCGVMGITRRSVHDVHER